MRLTLLTMDVSFLLLGFSQPFKVVKAVGDATLVSAESTSLSA
jgi:hypothetical protein